MTSPTPTSRYQPFYCEENIWQLCDQGDFGDGAYVVFISNARRTCALWSQRAAHSPGAPIVWDYHVVLIDDDVEPHAEVWDLDTLVGAPVPFERWWQATFPLEDAIPDEFRPCFRVIPADTFGTEFSSDRSHMRDDGDWKAPPPIWEPIYRPEAGMNLDRFIDMSDVFLGKVIDASKFHRRFNPGS
jgi:hypothetical protein